MQFQLNWGEREVRVTRKGNFVLLLSLVTLSSSSPRACLHSTEKSKKITSILQAIWSLKRPNWTRIEFGPWKFTFIYKKPIPL